VDLVLALARYIDPRARWMEIDVARSKSEPATRCNRASRREQSLFESEYLERAGILGLLFLLVVATSDETRETVRGIDPNLMGVDAGVERFGLRNQFADGSVRADTMHRHCARVVISREQILRRHIGRDVDGP